MRRRSTALRLTTLTAAVGLAAAGLSPGLAAADGIDPGARGPVGASTAPGTTTTVVRGSIGPDGTLVRTAT